MVPTELLVQALTRRVFAVMVEMVVLAAAVVAAGAM
jgi:hypothetical protein